MKIKADYLTDYEILRDRKKGELLCVEGNHLRKMSLGERILYRLSSVCSLGSYAKRVAEKVQGVVKEITTTLEADTDLEAEEIKSFYFKSISPLSQRVYSREILDTTFNALGNSIQTVIPKEATEQYIAAYKASRLWAKLGNYEMLDGSSGSYKIFDNKGTIFGVCKLSKEEPLAVENPRLSQQIKRFVHKNLPLWSQPTLFKTIAGQAHLAEEMTWIIGKEVAEAGGIENPVPETHKTSFALGKSEKEEMASFQLWLQGSRETASSYLGLSEEYDKGSSWERAFRSVYNYIAQCFGFSKIDSSNLKESDLEDYFDYLVIIDYLTGNHDRHGGNWFVMKDENDAITGIRLIDGGWSMSPAHPSSEWCMILLRHQYLWRKLGLSEKGFTGRGKAIIEKLHARADELQAKVEDYYAANGDEHAMHRGFCFRNRLDALFKLKDSTRKEVAETRTVEQFQKLEIDTNPPVHADLE